MCEFSSTHWTELCTLPQCFSVLVVYWGAEGPREHRKRFRTEEREGSWFGVLDFERTTGFGEIEEETEMQT